MTNSQAKLNFQEIAIATLLAIPTGLISAALVNSKLLFRFASKLRISDKLDDLGVWNKAFEASLNHWIIIRDVQNDLMYRGWVEAFSDGLEGNEILLRDVEVYRNSDGEFLYAIPGLYVALEKENNLRVEFQSWEFTENMHNNAVDHSLSHEEEEHRS